MDDQGQQSQGSKARISMVLLTVASHLVCFYYEFHFYEHLLVLGSNCFAYGVSARQHPTPTAANTGGLLLALLTFVSMFGKAIVGTNVHDYFLTRGCTLPEIYHYGPGDNITWEIAPIGGRCAAQAVRSHIIAKAMETWRIDHGNEMCWTGCVGPRTIESDVDGSSETSWIGFITMVSSGAIPTDEWCGSYGRSPTCGGPPEYVGLTDNAGRDKHDVDSASILDSIKNIREEL